MLQQLAAPQELYDRPLNLFVAEFIGSPAMNLVQARRVEQTATCGSRSARTAAARRRRSSAPGPRAYAGRQVVVGIRPEDMEDAALLRETRPDGVSVVVDIREDMGSEVFLHFSVEAEPWRHQRWSKRSWSRHAEVEEARFGGGPHAGRGRTLVARLDRTTHAREREPLDLEVDVPRLHFFDPETGVGVNESAAQPAA